MKKKILLIFVSFLILLGFSFSVSAEDFVFDAHDLKRPHAYILVDDKQVEQSIQWGNYISGVDSAIVCGPTGTPCVLVTLQDSADPIYRISASIDGVTAGIETYVYMSVQGRFYVTTQSNSVPSLDIRYHRKNDNGVLTTNYYSVSSDAWVKISNTQYYCDVSFTVTDPNYLQFYAFYLYNTQSNGVYYGFQDFKVSFGIDPNGAQVEANSMIADINSVITGSVNIAPLTSGVNNIVGNVTSMIPDTTDIPYVSDALGSLTQLTNIAAAEIGGFFDPFFSADMSVTIAGVTFNPFITFLIISVVITLITFAIKIFTRGDHER